MVRGIESSLLAPTKVQGREVAQAAVVAPDHRQVQEPCPGGHVANVGHPELIGTTGPELALDRVVSRRLTFVAPRSHGEAPATADALDVRCSREARHARAADAHVLRDEFGAYAWHVRCHQIS